MYRIRFHGRGGQGMKTASRILGSAFFHAGFEVQDAPRYGAERSGAPIFAYVRAARAPIRERGIIPTPDLVVVADDSLVAMPAAGVLQGLAEHSVLLLDSAVPAEEWRRRLNVAGPLLVLQSGVDERAELRFLGATCAGAAAGLLGNVIGKADFEAALADELATLGEAVLAKNRALALDAYDRFAPQAGLVGEGAAVAANDYAPPEWVDLPLEPADAAAPAIHAAATSIEVPTGLWRVQRPVLDASRCKRCWWVCSEACPDSAIAVAADGLPAIDYDHCKGCLICVAQCPSHAIETVLEREAA
jgi:pyruvate ferredoxin oxidoreductase gamma subunit